jgi:hypothetical protein
MVYSKYYRFRVSARVLKEINYYFLVTFDTFCQKQSFSYVGEFVCLSETTVEIEFLIINHKA